MDNLKYEDAVFLGLLLSLEHSDEFMKGFAAMVSAAFGKSYVEVMEEFGYQMVEKRPEEEQKSAIPLVL